MKSIIDYKILVVGSGSIGRRHMRNLSALGVQNIAACDTDADRLEQMVSELGIEPFTDYDKAIDTISPDLVFVCTPPIFHIPQAMKALEIDAHVFVEKPISHTLDGIEEIIIEAYNRNLVVQVGYNLRFHPGLQKIKKLLDTNIIGRIIWARVEVGQYLPDWRPWQDYRQSYTARQELGGGIILDASHELDYIIWLLGLPTEVLCMAGKVSDLEIDVEDCATLLLRFNDRAQADVHMDFVQREYTRSCKLVGDKGTIIWDYSANQIKIYLPETNSWETYNYDFDSNDMYVAEVQHFLDCVNRGTTPSVDLKQARSVLKVALSAKSAAMKGSLEMISW